MNIRADLLLNRLLRNKPICVLHIWRPEATGLDDDYPFDGIETYLCDSEDQAISLSNRLADEHPKWRFLIDGSVGSWQGA